jgi:hypothetical protein
MIDLLKEEHADIVTASPYHPTVLDRESSWRLLLSRMCSQLYRRIAPEKLYCYTSLFRICRRPLARPDMFANNGFLGVTEYLLTAAYCGATIVEYPTPLGTRRFCRSKMRTLQVIRDHLTLMARAILLNARLRWGGLPATGQSSPLYAITDDAGSLANQISDINHPRTELAWPLEMLTAEADIQHAEAI